MEFHAKTLPPSPAFRFLGGKAWYAALFTFKLVAGACSTRKQINNERSVHGTVIEPCVFLFLRRHKLGKFNLWFFGVVVSRVRPVVQGIGSGGVIVILALKYIFRRYPRSTQKKHYNAHTRGEGRLFPSFFTLTFSPSALASIPVYTEHKEKPELLLITSGKNKPNMRVEPSTTPVRRPPHTQ